jgi:hypothetical protein
MVFVPTPPFPADLCAHLAPAIPPISVTFPGGITLEGAAPPEQATQPLRVAKSLIDQAGPVMSGLAPFFKLLDAIMALAKLGSSIPDAILQLSPEPILEAIQELAPKLAAVAALIPQLSIPLMIVNLIDVVILFLQGVVGQLGALAEDAQRATDAAARAEVLDSDRLRDIAQCLQENVDIQTANMSASMGPIGKILEIITLLASLAGLPEMPAIGEFTDPAAGIAVLEGFVDTISDIRDAIPV